MPQTPSITLQPFQAADAAFFASMASDERVTRFIGDGRPWDRQITQDRIRAALRQDPPHRAGASRWFLAKEAGEPVGIVVSTRTEEGVEIGYWVSPDCWGRGIAGAMVDGALTTIPEVYETRELFARVDPANTASSRLLTRRGFQRKSHQRGLDRYALELPKP